MARPKGFKLSDEQKARMQAGRKAAKAKASENLIDTEIKVKKQKFEVKIIGLDAVPSATIYEPLVTTIEELDTSSDPRIIVPG